MKILVIGGAGFIGSHVVDRYIKEGHDVHVIDSFVTGLRNFLNPEARLIEMDASSPDMRDLLQKERYEIINIHAWTDNQLHGTTAAIDVKNNLLSLIRVLDELDTLPIKKLIYSSDSGINYGECVEGPRDETATILCHSPNNALKQAAESYLLAYQEKVKFDYTILRYSNVFGPRQGMSGKIAVIPSFIKAMLKGQKPVIFGDGEQTRDFIYVKDVARANLLALTSGSQQIFNIANQRAISVNQLFKILSEILEFNQAPELSKDESEKIIRHSVMNNEKARSVLGFYPDYTLEDGLQETLEHYQQLQY